MYGVCHAPLISVTHASFKLSSPHSSSTAALTLVHALKHSSLSLNASLCLEKHTTTLAMLSSLLFACIPCQLAFLPSLVFQLINDQDYRYSLCLKDAQGESHSGMKLHTPQRLSQLGTNKGLHQGCKSLMTKTIRFVSRYMGTIRYKKRCMLMKTIQYDQIRCDSMQLNN